ncbi:MAG: hypothetical protein DMG67_09165 [Acidobacteria bacterium]|nr:MAG: hypothetical protein DMG67_09165 [Acidobacteriota bacterium]
MLPIALLLAGTAQMSAQSAKTPQVLSSWRKQFHRRHRDLSELMDMASNAPPNLSAKALVTIAESPQLKNPEWKRNILLQAFDAAALAHDPMPRTFVLNGSFKALDIIGTRAQLEELISGQGVDRLSLQSEIVAEMLKIDSSAARDLYFRMPSPFLSRSACADAFVPDPSAYYAVLGEIAKAAFSSTEKQEQRDLQLVSATIRKMKSPSDLAPISRILLFPQWSREEVSLLAADFSSIMADMETDDRSFSSTLSNTDTEIGRVIDLLRSHQIATEPLLAAYRAYLTHGLTEERCADNIENDANVTKVVRRFNQQFASEGNPRLAPLDLTELKPAKIGGEPEMPRLFMDPASGNFLENIFDLAFQGLAKSADAEDQAARRDQVFEMFDNMQPESGEDDNSYVMRKGLAFTAVIEVMPPGERRERVLLHYADFLNSVADNSSDLAAWLGPLSLLLNDVGPDSVERKTLLEKLLSSPQPAVALYARLQHLQQDSQR